MGAEKSGEEIQDEYERLAREQLDLDSDWRLGTIATALPIGLDDKIDALDSNGELCDSERWQELAAHSAPLAWLPKGVIQVTMVSGSGDDRRQKAGFILTDDLRRQNGKPNTRTSVMDIEIEIGPAGKLALGMAQQKWYGDDPQIMQIARFAGQEMMAIQKSDDEPDVFELHFLGLVGSGFRSMSEAKESAPAFARAVFAYLSQIIND